MCHSQAQEASFHVSLGQILSRFSRPDSGSAFLGAAHFQTIGRPVLVLGGADQGPENIQLGNAFILKTEWD